jgi:hypothetical protein
MTKISHHFRIDPVRTEQLEKLAEYLSIQQGLSGLPNKKITKTDVIEYLIGKEFCRLKEEGNDI